MLTPPNSPDQFIENGLVHNPVVSRALIPQTQNRVNFSLITQPLQNLFNYCRNKALMAKIVIKATLSNRILRIEKACLRLIYPAPHNFSSAEFKLAVLEVSTQKEQLCREIRRFPNGFIHLPLIMKDLKKLDSLKSSLDKYSNFLEKYSGEIKQWEYDHLPIYEEIVRLKQEYQDLQILYVNTLRPIGPRILRHFHHVTTQFVNHHLPMPAIVKKEILQDWRMIQNSVIRPLGTAVPLTEGFYRQMNSLSATGLENTDQVHECERPMAFRNIGNSCYMDSSFQILFSTPFARKRINQPTLENTIEHLNSEISNESTVPQRLTNLQFQLSDKKKALEIRNEMLNIVDGEDFIDEEGLSYVDYFLSIMYGPSLNRLRDLIFHSGLHAELDNPVEMHRQKDAASVVELMMREVLEMPSKLQRITKTALMPNLIFPGAVEDAYTLQVTLNEVPGLETNETLEELVCNLFKGETVAGNFVFNPEEGQIIEPGIGGIEGVLPATVAVCETFYELKSLPEMMAVHLKRFKRSMTDLRSTKLNNLVDLPADGILDLSSYYTGPQNPDICSRYEITGYAVHSGTLESGHYVSYVKRGGKYWFCDDLGPTIREITEREFFGNKNAYMVMLKRIDV
jgi:hypothetical protein